MRTRIGSLILVALWIPPLASPLRADEPPSRPEWVGTWERPDGRRIPGRLVLEDASSLRFASEAAAAASPLEKGDVVEFDGPGPAHTAGSWPFRVELGLGRRISGRLGAIDDQQVRLDGSSISDGPTSLDRSGVHSVVQRLGEIQVVDDGFESLDSRHWSLIGDPELVKEPKLAGAHSLRLPAGGSAVTRPLDEPVAAGRLELSFYDDGALAPGQQVFVDLLFRGPTGPAPIRVILGWSESSHSVESPAGPALAVQRLARKPGWHRLSVRFHPEQTEIAIDGDNLAHGKGPGGPLVELRLASRTAGRDAAPVGLAATFDNLRLVRFSATGTALELDPSQDEVRLAGGDQIFGVIRRASASRVKMQVDGRDVELPWSEVSGLHFRRTAVQSASIEGTWLRVDWRAAPGSDPLELDRIDGALVALDADHLTLTVPYVGRVALPLRRIRRIEVLGRSLRIVIDPTSHHLGNDLLGGPLPLDPPQPEGRRLERVVELAEVPSGPVSLCLDVVQVAGEAAGLPFADLVQKGEIRTNVTLNGRTFDYLNHYIASKNETPERIELPIPAGLLHPGKNQLQIVQTGTTSDPNNLDDLGILEIALEFPHPRAVPAASDQP